MSKQTYKQLGFTLIELLATIVIFFVISMFVFNIVYSSNKQNIDQSAETVQINDAAYLLKQMTKDLRRSSSVITTIIDDKTTFTFKGSSIEAIYKYMEDDKKLLRNNETIINNIENFSLVEINNTVSIQFSLNDREYETKIALRKGK